MSLTTLIQNGFCALLDGPVIESLAQYTGKKAVSILQTHLTFSAFEIAETYQKSHNYAIAAIAAGLASPDEKRTFIQKLRHAKVKREFADQVDEHYLRSFADQHGVQSDALPALRQQLIENLNKLTELPPLFVGEQRPLTESELAAVIDHKGSLAITDLVLAQLRRVTTLDDTLAAFLRHQDLLGNAVLHFFVEQLRKEPRAEATFAALQREGLWADVRDLKAAQHNLTGLLEQQLAALKATAVQATENGNFAELQQLTPQLQQLQTTLVELPQHLQAAQVAWQTSQQSLLEFAQRFNSWALLLDDKVEQVLNAMATLHGTVIDIDKNVKQLLTEFRQFKQRFELDNQIKASDEFTHHTGTSRKLIQAAMAKLKGLPHPEHPDYQQLLMMAGTVLFSTGHPDNLAEAEQLLVQARDGAEHAADKALACFNLFQVRLRRKAHREALADLQTAITLDTPQYALHDVGKYPIKRILGAGGMGCVFLCQDVDALSETSVVVKCFWEGRKGSRQQVFREAIIMRDVGGAYIPKPLQWGFVDAARQTRPFFVTEYIDGALDGEQWLIEQGKLDVPTGIAVGLQVAKGLQVAHHKGVYHLDLKPANLLFKQTAAGLMVKIIDFGLARVATSLKQDALSRRSGSLTQFGQAIAGTLLYAPPEQLGETKYDKPGAKSDLFSLAATLYRLMTNESPLNLNPRRLTDAPPALFDLLCHCKEENPANRPDSAQQVVERLEEIEYNGYAEYNGYIEYNGYAKKTDVDIAKRQAELKQSRQTDTIPKRDSIRRERQTELKQSRQTDTIPKRDSIRRETQPQQAREKRSVFFPVMAVLVVVGLVILIGFNLSEKADTDAIPPRDSIRSSEAETDAIPPRDSIRSSEAETDTIPKRDSIRKNVFRDRLKEGSQGPEMVWIPAGRFRMGDLQGGGYDNEQPVHEVSVERFAMGRYEVSFAEYDLFAEATGRKKPSDSGWGRGNRPVINVSWDDATAYAAWLSQQTGHQYRLPTEAEWEYAARAGTETKYWWGNTASHEYANYGKDECCGGLAEGKDRWKYTSPVGSFAPNPFGLYDTVGNVWEWTCSEYENKYNNKKNKCSSQKSGSPRALRGGAWSDGPWYVRAAYRGRNSRGNRNFDVGLRLARL